jgi:hypothetical protein
MILEIITTKSRKEAEREPKKTLIIQNVFFFFNKRYNKLKATNSFDFNVINIFKHTHTQIHTHSFSWHKQQT